MRRLLVTFLPLAALCGCSSVQPYVSQLRLERGLVIVLPGIEGRSIFNEAICAGLDSGGVDWAIELHDWTSWLGPVYNLRCERLHRRETARLVRRIFRYRIAYPDRPVMLVGQSGGGAMAVWAAEALPAERKIEGIIMLAASMSPQYALEKALRNTRRGAVNFHSLRDWVLGIGTTVSGTMDGEHTASAGRVGFQPTAAASRPAEYDRLFQITWRPRMAGTGHVGIHITSGAAEFVAAFVAPFVLNNDWSDELVERVLNQEKAEPAPPAARTQPHERPSAPPSESPKMLPAPQ